MNWKTRLAHLGLVIAGAWGALALVNGLTAASVAILRFQPFEQDARVQATATVTLTVESAEDLGGFEFDLHFDPALMQFDAATLGNFLGSTGRNTGVLGPVVDNEAGNVTYGAFSYGSQAGPTGTGVLAVIEFTTLVTPGVSALTLQNVQLLNTAVQTQAVQVEDGAVTILSGPRVGAPLFPGSVASHLPLTVTAAITNVTSGSGVASATLQYGYTSPYTHVTIYGNGPGSSGNGVWSFVAPPQGDVYENALLHFSIAAWDGETPPGVTLDTHYGDYYTVTITDDDVEPPVFFNPSPVTVMSGHAITLQINITDARSAIADNCLPTESIYVEWDTDGELAVDAERADMDRVSGATYAITPAIAAQTEGVTITWHVYAADDDNSPSGVWSPDYETLVMSPLAGDLDNDCDVDIDDIMFVVARWNSFPGDPLYTARYDFDSDGDIDIVDVMWIASRWGDVCPMQAMCASDAIPVHFGQEAAEVYFEPAVILAQVGAPFTVSIGLSQVADLGGFEFDLLFDPTVITVTGMHLGNFLGSSGNQTAALGPHRIAKGRQVFGAFSYGEQAGATGSGYLAIVDLLLLRSAETVVRLEDVQLVTTQADSIPLAASGTAIIRSGWRVYLPLVLRN